MTSARMILGLGTALAAVGIWWLLPGGSNRRRALGGVLALAGFGIFAHRLPYVGDLLGEGLFGGMALVTIVAAVATISFRSPVYCAIWFGMTLAGTAGLFLLAGAEFLAVATIVVYAGAILVTFLFVLMLAEPQGRSPYDRHSWEAMISAWTGAVLIGVLTAMIGRAVFQADLAATEPRSNEAVAMAKAGGAAPVADHQRPPTIGNLGAVLFTQYLVAVEAAGALLFAALVGAAVIVAQGRAATRHAAAGKYSAKHSPAARGGGPARAT